MASHLSFSVVYGASANALQTVALLATVFSTDTVQMVFSTDTVQMGTTARRRRFLPKDQPNHRSHPDKPQGHPRTRSRYSGLRVKRVVGQLVSRIVLSERTLGMSSMTFYDAASIWEVPDVIGMLSERDFECLHMQEVERRILFKPVVTQPNKNIDIAFIGLKAYCGDDYRMVVRLPNFFVWAQHEKGFSKTMKSIMSIYCSRLKDYELGDGTAYYTNYLKVVPPVTYFGPRGGPALDAAIGQADGLGKVCQQLMRDEVEALIAHGCRVFVCFGVLASDFFQIAMVKGFGCTMKPAEPRLVKFDVAGTRCLLVRAMHFGTRGVHANSYALSGAMCRQWSQMP